MYIKHRSCRGLSLIEAAIVLGIVGLVAGGIFLGASAVFFRMRVNEISRGILTTYSNMKGYPAGTAWIVVNTMKIVPLDWPTPYSNNLFMGPYELVLEAAQYADSTRQITLSSQYSVFGTGQYYPAELVAACQYFLPQVLQGFKSDLANVVRLNDSGSISFTAQDLPLTPGQTQSLCDLDETSRLMFMLN